MLHMDYLDYITSYLDDNEISSLALEERKKESHLNKIKQVNVIKEKGLRRQKVCVCKRVRKGVKNGQIFRSKSRSGGRSFKHGRSHFCPEVVKCLLG